VWWQRSGLALGDAKFEFLCCYQLFLYLSRSQFLCANGTIFPSNRSPSKFISTHRTLSSSQLMRHYINYLIGTAKRKYQSVRLQIFGWMKKEMTLLLLFGMQFVICGWMSSTRHRAMDIIVTVTPRLQMFSFLTVFLISTNMEMQKCEFCLTGWRILRKKLHFWCIFALFSEYAIHFFPLP
jgi:hypothetical protein